MANPFKRPLTFGDPEQIAAIKAMNGDGLYCPECYAEDGRYAAGSARCRKCGAVLREGAAMERRRAAARA